MLSLEKLANATTKNRAEYTQLSTDLNRLEKEKQNELRMCNNEMQRFKSKYSKTNFTTDSPEASNVKMYETHNPGFCFKRNGEHRVQEAKEDTPPVDFEHLHFLLFTDGEVDIEKILCLHLLSSHETDHLTPPRRPRTNSNFMKKDSPLEQLIERSKDNNPKEAVLRAILPTYILDVHDKGTPNKRTLMDERLSTRLLLNEKILELIMTVVTALEHSNPEKVRHLISLAEDQSSLKRIFRKEHIQDFVMTLKDHSLVNSSFILTQPSKIKPNHLEIRTPSGALEDLVRFIRSNVLQFPKRGSWTILEGESRELITHSPLLAKASVSSSVTPKRSISTTSKKEVPIPKEVRPSDNPMRFRRKDTNYIRKNIESIPEHTKSAEEEDSPTPTKRKRSVDVYSIKNESKSDSQSKTLSFDSRKAASSKRKSQDGRKSLASVDAHKPDATSEEIKVHLKQTKCPACMEKWKIPLPSPKVPRFPIKSNSSSAQSSTERMVLNPILKTNSMLRISSLIAKEEYKLNSYDRRYSNASTASTQVTKKPAPDLGGLDLVALNILDLEKIRHEIREKETKKKLEKFLTS